LWSVVERESNRRPSNSRAELVEKIKSAFASLPEDQVKRACQRFRHRVESVIQNEGDFIE
jgi:hypothetical protein